MCLQFEESLISHKMAQMGDESEDETPDNEEDDGKGFLLSDDGKDIDLRYGLQFVPVTFPVFLCWRVRDIQKQLHAEQKTWYVDCQPNDLPTAPLYLLPRPTPSRPPPPRPAAS